MEILSSGHVRRPSREATTSGTGSRTGRARTGVFECFYLLPSLYSLTQAENSVYSELDRLSSLWEALNKQVQSRVFDLSAMAEKATKMLTEACYPRLGVCVLLTSRTESESFQQVLRRYARQGSSGSATMTNMQSPLRRSQRQRSMLRLEWYVPILVPE